MPVRQVAVVAAILVVSALTVSCGGQERSKDDKPPARASSHVGGAWCDSARKLAGWIGDDGAEGKSTEAAVEGAVYALTATQQGLYELSSTAPAAIAEDATAVEQYWYGLDARGKEPPSADLVTTFVTSDVHHKNLERWIQDKCASGLFYVGVTGAEGASRSSGDDGAWKPSAVELVDTDGYAYTFGITAEVTEPGESDITNAPPGKTDFVRPAITGSVAQTNTTPGRAEQGVHVELIALWIVPAEACSELRTGAISSNEVGMVYCPIASGRTQRSDHLEFDDLGPGMTAQSTTLDRDSDLEINRGFQVRRISEESGSALAEATERDPDAWLAVPEVDVPPEYELTWHGVTDQVDSMGSPLAIVSYRVLASDGLPAPCGEEC